MTFKAQSVKIDTHINGQWIVIVMEGKGEQVRTEGQTIGLALSHVAWLVNEEA